MPAPRLLIVDDEPFNLEIITEYFDGLGFTLDTAVDGEAAWEKLQGETRYDLVVLDRMMPRLDGVSLLKRIKSDARLAPLPVVMQTAAGNAEQVKEGLAAGAYYYLIKPYERESLLSIVRSALADNDARRALQRQLAEHGNALRLLSSAEFSLRTLEEASILAAFLAQGCPEPERAVLGLSELLVNGVEHGNLAISYHEKSELKRQDNWAEEVARRLSLPENLEKRVKVILSRDTAELSITIIDMGHGFDWQQYLDFAPERAFDPNGRGIALARLTSFDSIEYKGCGNTVVVTLKHGR